MSKTTFGGLAGKAIKELSGKLAEDQRYRRSGKTLSHAVLEATTEMQINPPATPKEAESYCRIQIKRCSINLANAKDRGDSRAVLHLERKLAVYQFLHRLVKGYPAAEECPHCKVVTMEKGVCPCCGYTKEEKT